MDGDHALCKVDIFDPELDQFGGADPGLQQGLQHQPGTSALDIGLVEEAQFLLDRQALDARSPLGRSMQAGTLPGGFEYGFALCVVHPLTDKDGGDGSGNACNRGMRGKSPGGGRFFSCHDAARFASTSLWSSRPTSMVCRRPS